VLTVMFSAIFSTISIIEDRREGFMLSMLVSPASRTSLVLGKILGSATLAWAQGLIFLAFAPLAGVHVGIPELPAIAAAIFLISFTLTGLGFLIAWKMNSIAGFHGLNEPAAAAHVDGVGRTLSHGDRAGLVKALMWVNPLTYAIGLLSHLLHMPNAAPGVLQSLLVTVAFGLILLMASGMVAAQKATKSAA
jgi:ABC-2 type transport system permease protein